MSEPLTPEQDKTQQRMRPLILAAMDTHGGYENARNALRYEAARHHRPNLFMMQPEEIDALLDELILQH